MDAEFEAAQAGEDAAALPQLLPQLLLPPAAAHLAGTAKIAMRGRVPGGARWCDRRLRRWWGALGGPRPTVGAVACALLATEGGAATPVLLQQRS